MASSWAALGLMIMVALWCPSPDAWSVERKQWVQLTNCKYLDYDYNDGDSFHVRCGADDFIARLYFVDAPEANFRYRERVREQSEYFGITLDESLRSGKQAALKVHQSLQKPFTIWTRWASAPGRTKMARFFGFVEIESQGLAELLLSSGLARTKGVFAETPQGVPSRETLQRLRALEEEARQQRRGA